jgi:hypothetical protein
MYRKNYSRQKGFFSRCLWKLNEFVIFHSEFDGYGPYCRSWLGWLCLKQVKKACRQRVDDELLSLRVELKTSRLLNGCSNQLSYESAALK